MSNGLLVINYLFLGVALLFTGLSDLYGGVSEVFYGAPYILVLAGGIFIFLTISIVLIRIFGRSFKNMSEAQKNTLNYDGTERKDSF